MLSQKLSILQEFQEETFTSLRSVEVVWVDREQGVGFLQEQWGRQKAPGGRLGARSARAGQTWVWEEPVSPLWGVSIHWSCEAPSTNQQQAPPMSPSSKGPGRTPPSVPHQRRWIGEVLRAPWPVAAPLRSLPLSSHGPLGVCLKCLFVGHQPLDQDPPYLSMTSSLLFF